MPSFQRLLAIAVAVASLASPLTACQWRGLNSFVLPGTAGQSPGSYTIHAQLPDVVNIEQNSRVRVADVNVGNVTSIELRNFHALVTMRIDGNVHLPANATAKLGQTSLLGSMHIELAAPTNVAPVGELTDGSIIPLASASAYPTTEETLAAVSMLLNGGGLGQLQNINKAMATALAGRENDFRTFLAQLEQFVTQANEQTTDVISATQSLNTLVQQFADKKEIVDTALATLPGALAVLNEERGKIADAVTTVGQFSGVSTAIVNESKEALVANLRNLAPVLEAAANAGPALTRSLGILSTFPWPKDTLANWMRGDYANATLVLDLTLSRIDSGLFTGTRWQGNLTELEMQWGRTIGQMPSPYTAGNPLIAPYNQDQGP